VLVSFNPAALRANLGDVRPGGTVIVNSDAFTEKALARAGYAEDPRPDVADRFQLVEIPLTKLNREALRQLKIGSRDADRCKNFFALGLMYWLYNRPMDSTLRWLEAGGLGRGTFETSPPPAALHSSLLRGAPSAPAWALSSVASGERPSSGAVVIGPLTIFLIHILTRVPA